MKKFLKLFWRLLSFALVLLVLMFGASLIFQPKGNSKESGMLDSTANGILGEPENTIDTLIIGDSEAYSAFVPLKIWTESGITSYVCATSAQVLCYSYEFLEKTFEKQQPRIVMLETNVIYRAFTKTDILTQKLSEKLSVFRYHDRWKTLSLRDWSFGVDLSSTEINKGYIYNNAVSPASTKDYMKPSPFAESFSKQNEKYVKMMRDFCEANGARFVLVSSPSTKNWSMPRHNAVEKLAKKLGVEYLDLNLMRRQVPINWKLETKDKGDHLNYSGATKVSVFLAKYLQKTELFKDKRNDSAYAQWHDAVKQFNESIKTS